MQLWIGIHLRHVALEVYQQRWATDRGCVILEGERTISASPAAVQAGVRKGMRRGGVLMLLPDALIFERSEHLEADALLSAATAMLQYTPQVTIAEEDTVLIDIGASLTLFGGIRNLCRRVRQSANALGFSVSISSAPNARGAWLLARSNTGRCMSQKVLESRLDRLPVSMLPPARPYLAWLEGIGCMSIGEVRRLPRPGLQRRCGRAILEMLDAGYGQAPELFEWVEAPEVFRAGLELFARIENAELLLNGAKSLLEQLAGWLTARQLAVLGVTLLLEHERGRVAMAPTSIGVALAEATWSDDHLVRLLKERLGRVELPAPVIGLTLLASKTEAMAPPNDSLFPDTSKTLHDQVQMIEVLIARLGAENVLQACPTADYRPEEANNWAPFNTKPAGARAEGGMTPSQMPFRPTWLLAKPIALLIRNNRPFYGSPLKIVSSFERIEAGWWSDLQARDYYVAEGADHSLYWIYRERISVDDGDSDHRWYLHGLFG